MFEQLLSQIPAEYQKYLEFLPYLPLAFLVALLLTPVIGYIARKYNVFDFPTNERRSILNRYDNPDRHIHTHKVALLGGLAVLIPLILFLLLTSNNNPAQISLAVALIILAISGVLDDIFNLPAIVQLLLQIFATLIVAISTINLAYINNPFGGLINLNWSQVDFNIFGLIQQFIFPGDLILMGWILVCINAIKWLNGLDVLMESNLIVTLLFIYIIGVRTFSNDVTAISLVAAGLLAGFTIFNLPPAKIFTGGTKSAYGLLIATLAVMNGSKMATTILVLAVPLIDFIFVIAKRIVQYRPKNLLMVLRYNDKNHLHHQLLDAGFSKTQVVLIEVGITLVVGSIAVLTAGALKLFAIMVIGLLVVIGIFAIHTSQTKEKIKEKIEKKKTPKDTPESRYSY